MTPDVTLGVMLAIVIGVMCLVFAVAWAWFSARWYQVTIPVSTGSGMNYAKGSNVVIDGKHYMQVVRVEPDKLVVRRPRR